MILSYDRTRIVEPWSDLAERGLNRDVEEERNEVGQKQIWHKPCELTDNIH